MKKFLLTLTFLAALLALLVFPAAAQTYSFSIPQETVNVFWNEDGTESIDYVFVFQNDPSASPIDYVDVGLPNSDFVLDSIHADVDGTPLSDISASGYQGTGSGVAVGLGAQAIQPGETGSVHVFIGTVRRVLYPDSQDKNYASAVFDPTTFGSQYVHNATDLTVTFHLPPGVKPDEPRWHAAPDTFPAQPATGIDDQGRIVYTWQSPYVFADLQFEFGASFPASYVPDSAIVRPSLFQPFISLALVLAANLPFFLCVAIVIFIVYSSITGRRRRKLQYLPPKISIEGHGIKRGLTAIEAGILMEQPVDKILTMILFAVVKKEAATVTQRNPLQIKNASPLPPGLLDYEVDFLKAFDLPDEKARQKALQTTIVSLVKSVSQKMKGFSRKETVAYYQDIMKKAWAQVEAAGTPEVKSQKFDEVMEWTLLDKDYDTRTRDVFHGGPVFVPVWWGRYDPGFSSAGQAASSAAPSGAATSQPGSISLPHLPGSDFAASVVNGVQSFSSGVIGDLTAFTSGITQQTNPPPPPSSSSYHSGGGSSGGGFSCACACACAGCACACAGGGR